MPRSCGKGGWDRLLADAVIVEYTFIAVLGQGKD